MAKEERQSGGEKAVEGGRGGGEQGVKTAKDQEESKSTEEGNVDWIVRPVGASKDELLKWATKLATEVEGIINSIMLKSLHETVPHGLGMMPSRRAKNGWYPGIEEDRKLVSQYDKMDFKMRRVGGWEAGREYRAKLVRLAQWRGKEEAPLEEWTIVEQEK